MVNENDKIDDETGVAGLLGSLKRVEAPGDFEFGVRSRIAKGRPVVTPWFMRPAMAGGVLGTLIVLVLGSVYFYRNGSVETPPQTVVASERPPTERMSVPTGDGVIGNERPVSNDEIAVVPTVPSEPVRPPAVNSNSGRDTVRTTRKEPTGTSFVEAGTQGEKKYPRGIEPNARVNVKPRDFDRTATMAPADVLGVMGAKTGDVDGELRVTEVGENTPAAKAGLKVGDIVEAVDKKPVTPATRYKGQFSVRSVTIKRDGASLEIDLRPKN